MNKIFARRIILTLLALGFLNTVLAQAKQQIDEKAFQILDKAFGNFLESENVGIQFEGIAYGIQKPEDIFTLPVYKIFRGGYLYMNKNKFQIELGLMKSMSDGKLMVVIDEQSKTLLIDSVRKNSFEDGESEEMSMLINEDFKESNLIYRGIATVNKHQCHKISSYVKGTGGNAEVTYWVDAVTGQLYLMSENQNGSNNVYWFNRIGKAPENHKYDVYFPKKSLTTFQGYTVLDNRYTESAN